jgi:choline/carnitine/betaine transport
MSTTSLAKELIIKTSPDGFYAGFNKTVTIGSKLIIVALVLWMAIFPTQASEALNNLMNSMLSDFGAWYIYVMLFYALVSVCLAVVPSIGSRVLGQPGERPEFSRFSWYAMMFGAGIGIGMLTFATAEPLSHFVTNPDIILGHVDAQSAESLTEAVKWTSFHWGISAWGCYALGGLAFAFFSFNRGLPLTVRSALTPLFGQKLEGGLGHFVDITAIIATLVGIAVTIGFGVSQFAAGVYEVSGASWLVDSNGLSSTSAKIAALAVIIFASTLSAISGVGKGIKWLSNLNLTLSLTLLGFYLVFGPTALALETFISSTKDYISTLPALASTYWPATEDPQGKALFDWQTSWTLFTFAWWIGFAPFVSLFLARISRGRSIREFVFGTMLVPPMMCCIWITLAGTAAIDLELNGAAAGAIMSAGTEFQLFATLKLLVSEPIATAIVAIVIVPLLLTFLVTSGDSAVLVVNTISSGGSTEQKGISHIVIWGMILGIIILILLLAGGMGAIRAALLIGALPFSVILALIGVSLTIALVKDAIGSKA